MKLLKYNSMINLNETLVYTSVSIGHLICMLSECPDFAHVQCKLLCQVGTGQELLKKKNFRNRRRIEEIYLFISLEMYFLIMFLNNNMQPLRWLATPCLRSIIKQFNLKKNVSRHEQLNVDENTLLFNYVFAEM